MRRIAELIDRVLTNATDDAVIRDVRRDVHDLTSGFPLYTPAEESAARL